MRLREDEGGPLFDIGIYCLNAARYLFRSDPEEVLGWHTTSDDPRFQECPEMTSALLRFPGERLATFTCSFGVSAVASPRDRGAPGGASGQDLADSRVI